VRDVNEATSRGYRYLKWAALLALTLVWAIPYSRWYIDDTYIYLQFARNLATGHGFSFNAGQITPAVTGPLWVFLIAAGEALTGGQLIVARTLSLLAGAGAVFVFFALAKRLLPAEWLAWLGTALFAFDGWWSRTPYSGMESAAGVLVVLGVLLLRLQEEERDFSGFSWSTVLAAVGILVRPEMVVLLALSLGYRWLLTRKFRGVLIEAAIAAAVLSPYVIYALATFGTVVPTTFYAKRDLVPWAQRLVPTLVRTIRILGASQALQILLVGTGLVLAPKKMLGDRRTWLAWTWMLVLPTSYIVRGLGSLVSSRYLIMVSPLITLFALLALDAIVSRLAPGRRRVAYTVVVAVLAAQTLWFQFGVVMPSSMKSMADFDAGWRAMGLAVRDSTPPNAQVAASAMGIVGYYSDRQIVDLGGLLDPKILGYPTVSGLPFAEYLRQHHVSYVVLTEAPGSPDPSPALRLVHVTRLSSGSGLADSSPAEMRLYEVDWAALKDSP